MKRALLLPLFENLCFICPLFMPFLKVEVGLTFAEVMLLQGMYMLFSLLLQIPTGAFADVFGRKTSIVLGFLTLSVASIVYGMAYSFLSCLIGEALWALGSCFISGAFEAFVYEIDESSFRRNLSYTKIVSTLSLGISGIIGGFLAEVLTLRELFFITSVPFLSGAVFSLTLKETKGREEERSIKLSIERSALWYVLNLSVIGFLGYYFLWLWPAYLVELGERERMYGIYLFSVTLSQSIAAFLIGRARMKRERAYLFLSSFIPGVLLAITSFIKSSLLALPLFTLSFALLKTRDIVLLDVINKKIKRARATLLSSVYTISTFLITLFNPFVGMLMDISVFYTMLVVGTLLSLLSILLLRSF